MSIERVPPNDVQAERAILGAILLNNAAMSEAALLISVDDFYRTGHQLIFKAILDLTDTGEAADIVTLTSYLRRNNLLDNVGGTSYVAELTNEVPSVSHAKHYAQVVQKLSYRRKAIVSCTELIDHAYASDDIEDAVATLDIALEAPNSSAVETFKRTLAQRMDYYDKVHSGDITPGLRHGFMEIEDLCPMHPGDLVVIGGRPGMGKTALGLGFANGAAFEKLNIDYYSLEMFREQIADRRVAMVSHVDGRKFRKGGFTDSDFAQIDRSVGRIGNNRVRVLDKRGIGTQYIKSCAANRKRKEGLDLIVIDHLGLLRARGRHNSTHEAITNIVVELKTLAGQLNVPIILLAQLNRAVENRDIPIPRMSDLRESGSIEENADAVLFIYRQDYYQGRLKKEEEASKGKKKLLSPELAGIGRIFIAKSRHGIAGGHVDLEFKAHCTSYVNIERFPHG